jgi:hypothetical protein
VQTHRNLRTDQPCLSRVQETRAIRLIKVVTACIVLLLALDQAAHAANVQPCAIRWDAWYDPHASSEKAQHSLDDPRWISRAPIHCTIDSGGSLKCIGTQDVIDHEIRSATELADLNCWAFVQYSESSTLSAAWRLFQTSPLKERVKWTWITFLALFGANADREHFLDKLAVQMNQPNYLRIALDGVSKPVLFLLWNEREFRDVFHNDYDELRRTLGSLNDRVTSTGAAPPYYVVLRGDPQKAADIIRKIQADAIGSYSVTVATRPDHSYFSLRDQTRTFWDRMLATGVPIVPIVMTGFDQRPMIDHPMDSRPLDYRTTPFYYPATNDELTQELHEAFEFVRSNPTRIPSKMVLIYSWNENGEGGGSLNETLGDPKGERLRAFRRSLSPRDR